MSARRMPRSADGNTTNSSQPILSDMLTANSSTDGNAINSSQPILLDMLTANSSTDGNGINSSEPILSDMLTANSSTDGNAINSSQPILLDMLTANSSISSFTASPSLEFSKLNSSLELPTANTTLETPGFFSANSSLELSELFGANNSSELFANSSSSSSESLEFANAKRALENIFSNSSAKLRNASDLLELTNVSSWLGSPPLITQREATIASPPEVVWRSEVTYDIELDDLDRAIIIACVVAFLLLVLLVLVCTLHPSCPLHELCPLRYGDERKKEKKSDGPVYGSMDDPLFEKVLANGKGHKKGQRHDGNEQHPVSKARIPKASRPALWSSSKTLRESSEASDWSDVSLPEMIEMKQDPQGKSRKAYRTSDYSSSASSIPSPVQPESRLAYGLTFDRAHSRLYIRVIQLGNFRVTDPDGALSPYVKVRVYRTPRHFFTFKLKTARELPLNQLEGEMQTRIQRRTDNPVYNECFEMMVDEPDVTAYTVKFLVCDYDKFSRHVIVGEVTVELSKVDLSSGEEILTNDLIEGHHEENLGDLHVALMYLPTAEKLSVSILNAKGLSTPEAPKRHTDVTVRIVLMYDGRPLKKMKTSSRHNDCCPVFNETFIFDVPAYQLDKVYFHIAVIANEKDREDVRHLLGRIYIGVNFDPDARAQWLEMVHNTRKQVACWHKLQS